MAGSNMPGTILITGANGSVAFPLVQHLLVNYPEHTLLLTIRNPSSDDENSNRLRETIKQHASISSKTQFWNLNIPLSLTANGYEQTVQINHISHAALTLKLLLSFQPAGGRIILFSSDSHWPGKNGLEKIPPSIPVNLDELVKPPGSKNVTAHGFLEYARSKLTVTMWAYALNRRLEKSAELAGISVVALNPRNLADSAALRRNTPPMLQFLSRWVIKPARPFLLLMDPTMRTVGDAAVDLAELAVSKTAPGERGFFTMHKKDQSSPDSLDEQVQEALWRKTAEWAHVTESALGVNGHEH